MSEEKILQKVVLGHRGGGCCHDRVVRLHHPPPAPAVRSSPISKDDLVLVASVINTTNPYMASMIDGAKALSAKLGVPLEIVDSQGSSQTEISKIQAILAQGKKVALMVNTVASSDAPTIVNAVKAAGGYVVVWWNKPDDFEPWDVGNNFVAFQKHSGVESGRVHRQGAGRQPRRQGQHHRPRRRAGQHHRQTRVAGCKEALKAYPDIKLLETRSRPTGIRS